MKRYYSLKGAVSFLIQALLIFALPWLFCIFVYAEYSMPFAQSWRLVFVYTIPLDLFAAGLVVGALFNFKKITVTEDYIRVSLFGFIIKEYSMDSVVDILAIHAGNGRNFVTVIFSKLAIPEYWPPKEERALYKKLRIKFLFTEKDFAVLKNILPVPIKGNRPDRPNIEPKTITSGTRTITITRKRRFWACGVPMYCCLDGEFVAILKNGKTIDIQIDSNGHELYIRTYFLLPFYSSKSNVVLIDADADARLAVKSFELEIIPAWWTGDTGLVLNQTDIS